VKRTVHKSHRMGEPFSDVRSPAGTPRFYGVRECLNCGAEDIAHPAGKFTADELVRPCESARCSHEVRMQGMNFPRWRRCRRPATKKGLCAQHQPDAIKARERQKLAVQKQNFEKRKNVFHARMRAKGLIP
jgi:hypothetical protein